MGLRQLIGKALGYPLGTGQSGFRLFEMQVPPGWGYQNYLRAYGEIGWLYGCVNVIAQAVADVPWHLYQKKAGELTEIEQHDFLDLWTHVNPFQTLYQFLYLSEMYKSLVGESFWVLNRNGKGKPGEMWLAPPAYMNVVPSETEYISHYEYKRGSVTKRFEREEVLHVMTPNPFNPYRGLSPAQALTVDLDSERYAARYQQKLFFNDATPGFMIEYPADNLPSADARKELVMEWDERHKGYRNRGKTGFLWGGKANVLTMTNRDMDFEALRKFNRDAILGAYHVPRSILGITEDVNRANADAAQYVFAKWVVLPELTAIREAVNEQLLPMYGRDLHLDFDNPVPEDMAANTANAERLFKASLITRNEARDMVELDAVEGPEGEEYFVAPANPFEGLAPKNLTTINMPRLAVAKAMNESQAEAYWKDYVTRAETFEGRCIEGLRAMWREQQNQVIAKLDAGKKDNLLDRVAAKKEYIETMQPILEQAMSAAQRGGEELVKPINPHKQADIPPIPPVVSAQGLKWLKTRMTWAAMEIGEESAARLAATIAEGFKIGESMDQIRKRIETEFDYFGKMRATRIARTEVMVASNIGAEEGYKEAGLNKSEWYTAIDERVCEICEPLHGEIHLISEGFRPPAHVDCRCTLLPVIE